LRAQFPLLEEQVNGRALISRQCGNDAAASRRNRTPGKLLFA
jgi:hypothetical protein